jgi:hypothetical protein
MLVLLFPFLFLCILLNVALQTKFGFRRSFVTAVLIFSTIVALLTETLNLSRSITHTAVVVSWSFLSLLALAPLLTMRGKLVSMAVSLWNRSEDGFKRFELMERLLLGGLLALFILLAVQSVLYPSNTIDTTVYHLPRIVSWIGQGSVEHYPTHIYRQLYQPPFSEFAIMHLNLLQCNDLFTNLVQLFFLFSCAVATDLLIVPLGLSYRGRLACMILVVCLPAAILQASSAKSDVVLSFFILSTALFAIRIPRTWQVSDFLLLGSSIGLATLTRGTSYLFLLPIVLLLFIPVVAKLPKDGFRILPRAACSLIIFLVINAGHYSRNFKLSGHPIVDREESRMYSNENMSPSFFLSNVFKNMARQVGPYPLNKLFHEGVVYIHEALGMTVDIPGNSFLDMKFTSAPTALNNEVNTPNFMHLYLTLFALLYLFTMWMRGRATGVPLEIILLMFVVIVQYSLFSLYLRWQPYHTRVLVPVFILAVPLVVYSLEYAVVPRPVVSSLLSFSIAFALYLVLFNGSRPLFTWGNRFPVDLDDDRFKKYFTVMMDKHGEYRTIRDILDKRGYQDIGIYAPKEDIILYPLLYGAFEKRVNPVYIRVENITKRIGKDSASVDCVVTSSVNEPAFVYKGKIYKNLTRGNKSIWVYE